MSKKDVIHLAAVFPFFECGKHLQKEDQYSLDRAYSTCPECNRKFDCLKERKL